MKRSGYDARRRNRNIGTSKQGHGQDNCLSIPERWFSARVYYEILRKPIILKKLIGGRVLPVVIESPTPPYLYPCTVDDVIYLLSHVPKEFTENLDFFVFRHPTCKQRLLRSCWGRIVYFADLANQLHSPILGDSGTAIYIESCKPAQTWKWQKSNTPRAHEELNRLREDGHSITLLKRHFEIRSTLESSRNTILYRTILHELGHLEDWLTDDRYDTKSTHDQEVFAHKFADRLAQQLSADGIIPFDRIADTETLNKDRLPPEYFGLTS